MLALLELLALLVANDDETVTCVELVGELVALRLLDLDVEADVDTELLAGGNPGVVELVAAIELVIVVMVATWLDATDTGLAASAAGTVKLVSLPVPPPPPPQACRVKMANNKPNRPLAPVRKRFIVSSTLN